jgi:ubiquinone/menaquinone biosynthesis C-methylase UbiE
MRVFTNYFYQLGENARKNRIQEVIKILEQDKNAIYLDCGTEDCTNTLQLAKVIGTPHIYGVEISKKNIDLCKKLRVTVKESDLNKKIPYKKNFFDCVTALQVIEHLVDIDTFLEELYRVTKPGGYVIISTENLSAWHNIAALMLGMQPSSGPHVSYKYQIGFHPLCKRHNKMPHQSKNIHNTHIKIMTRNTLIKLVEHHGFTVEKRIACNYYPFRGNISKILSRIDPIHALSVIVKLRKPL